MLKWYLFDGVFVWKEKYQNEKKIEEKNRLRNLKYSKIKKEDLFIKNQNYQLKKNSKFRNKIKLKQKIRIKIILIKIKLYLNFSYFYRKDFFSKKFHSIFHVK